MEFLDLGLSSPFENVALDEALLEEAEDHQSPRETLRLWESDQTMVVIGRGSRAALEVELGNCDERGIPVIRRCSGGAAIVAGAGCLMYSVILSYQMRPQLRSMDMAHRFVLERIRSAVASVSQGDVCIRGTSDLALSDRKFSGNSLRCRKEHFLYHGTLLYDFPLPTVAEYLRTPPRQPDYRQAHDHLSFITNLLVPVAALRQAIRDEWAPRERVTAWPDERMRQLVAEKYSKPEWNLRL